MNDVNVLIEALLRPDELNRQVANKLSEQTERIATLRSAIDAKNIVIEALYEENTRLRAENADLHARIKTLWETTNA